MSTYYDQQIQRFLEGQQPDVAALLEQAYLEAGGHYAEMSAAERQHQARIDSFEFITDVVRGSVDRPAIQAMIGETHSPIMLAEDILRMAIAFEGRFTAFVQATLPHDPLLAEELARRARNLIASFRTNLTAAQVDCLLQQFPVAVPYV
jgi:hypothetical protein